MMELSELEINWFIWKRLPSTENVAVVMASFESVWIMDNV
jgi:hypothetical protein